ncbi:MAG: aminoglycoside phosphotransferase family protein [Clostridia bacterium]|nr:aminoglycoside phosphotransferase family protein [Clostridia bacterium]
MSIQEICSLFVEEKDFISQEEITVGNINRTYKLTYQGKDRLYEYVIQRINKSIFTNPEKLMDNIVRVSAFLCKNVEKEGLDTDKHVLKPLLSIKDGLPFVIDEDGEYWRCYVFVPNSITYNATTDLSIIEKAGSAFGKFQNDLDGFDASTLFETIVNFHNTISRYENFHKAIKDDVAGRVKEVEKEIEAYKGFEEKACLITKYLQEGKLPLRVTHNDTKANNVCFDKDTGEVLAVLDLDTVMPGAIAFDYGDAIRFIANTLIEDDPNYDAVDVDLAKYEAFTKGFVSAVKNSLTNFEKATLNLGAFTMTAECGVRFLTDYLSGDTYFKIKYPEHNIVRARNQIAYANAILKRFEQMEEILKKYL